ncbi:hypothetical protein DIC82_17890 [Clostridium beijerinckii]|nr:hypothetical protein DIC82_17890 [Clostridium beijerinckii]
MADYRKIQPESSITPQESRDFLNNIFRSGIQEQKSSDVNAEFRNSERTHLLPRNGGEWSDEPGNSDWKPNPEVIPGDRNGTNPEHKTWGEIMKQYGFESIPFKDGAPDFSEVVKGQVEIEDFTDDRDANFDQADEKLAEQRGCTPEEVAKWRDENKYTWHECRDCKTMQKVPTEVHGNISHSGGVSEYKSQNKEA